MNTGGDQGTPGSEPQGVDDDALEFVTGGVLKNLATNPPSYSVNSTIYFQATISSNIT